MQVCQWPGGPCPTPGQSVTTLGVFDGVHVGHQEILRAVVDAARRGNATSVVITFDRHPRRALGGEPQPCITSLPHRLRLFEELGLDLCVVIRFADEIPQIAAANFARRAFRDLLRTRLLIVGPDCRFGRDAEGDLELCRRMSGELGMEARVVPPVTVEGDVVSSTGIRRAVMNADLERAARLLGRPFSLLGTVVRGAGRGRTLGFPTANLNVHGELTPRKGVYVGQACVKGAWMACVISIGAQRTFCGETGEPSAVEVHVMDAGLDLCGEDIEVRFVRWLRGQKRFPTACALAEQIARDVDAARALLSGPQGVA